MRLVDYLDKGASLGPDRPCLTTDGVSLSYREVQGLSRRVAAALVAVGVTPGDKVAILSANDPVAFSCVFGISRAGAVWCPINPRNEAAENQELLDLFDCSVLVYQAAFGRWSTRSVTICPGSGPGCASTLTSPLTGARSPGTTSWTAGRSRPLATDPPSRIWP